MPPRHSSHNNQHRHNTRYFQGCDTVKNNQDINITTEMNTSQMAAQEQEKSNDDVPTHRCNLTQLPTKMKDRVSMTKTGQITGV